MSISTTHKHISVVRREELEFALRVVLDSSRFSILSNDEKSMVLLYLENGGEYAPENEVSEYGQK